MSNLGLNIQWQIYPSLIEKDMTVFTPASEEECFGSLQCTEGLPRSAEVSINQWAHKDFKNLLWNNLRWRVATRIASNWICWFWPEKEISLIENEYNVKLKRHCHERDDSDISKSLQLSYSEIMERMESDGNCEWANSFGIVLLPRGRKIVEGRLWKKETLWREIVKERLRKKDCERKIVKGRLRK